MANEAVLVFRTSQPIPFIVANGTGIEKGAILKMTDPFTAIANSAGNDAVAGIAASEKIASDGKTSLGVYRSGIFKVTLSGSCTVGDSLTIDIVPNMVKRAPNFNTLSGSNIIGTALETGTTAETILMDLNPTSVRYA